jgi:hypothetical protein
MISQYLIKGCIWILGIIWGFVMIGVFIVMMGMAYGIVNELYKMAFK